METKWVESYLNYIHLKNSGSDYTQSDYLQDFMHFNNYLESQDYSSYKDVDRYVATYFIIYLKEDKQLAVSSIQRTLSCLRNFYTYLKNHDLVTNNPFIGLKAGKRHLKLPDVLSYEDVCYLLDNVDTSSHLGIRNKAILELLYATGMRLSEITSLKLDTIDFNHNQIYVTGKGNKERVVFFNHHAYDALKNYLAIRSLLTKDTIHLWVNHLGNRLTERGIQSILQTHCKNIGYQKKVHPHLLRHCFATHMLNNGADIKTIQCLLGHSSLSATQIYTHVSIERMKSSFTKSHLRNERNED